MDTVIPRRLIRTVPLATSSVVEDYWARAAGLHHTWDHITYRDPIDPVGFPATAPWWGLCHSGAQLAGLIRLEALYLTGGIYIDSDVELFRPLEPLREHPAFAAWEDENTVPDAVLGAEAGHPAILACIELAIARLRSYEIDWRTGNGAWATGPGVTTTVLVDRPDVTLLGPDSFYPVHYSRKGDLSGYRPGPDTYGLHHWHGSWLP